MKISVDLPRRAFNPLLVAALFLFAGCSSYTRLYEMTLENNLKDVINYTKDKNSRDLSAESIHDNPSTWETGIDNYRPEILKHLIVNKKLDVTVKEESEENTPLHIAVLHGRVEIARLLLDAKADINAKNKDGRTPLDYLLLKYQVNNVLAEIGYGSLVKGVDDPVSAIATTSFLVMHGADVNSKNNTGCTPLYYAIGCGEAFVSLLLAKGADVNMVQDTAGEDAEGKYPLHVAASSGNIRIVKMLIDKGANVNAVSATNKRTPLHYAAMNGHSECGIYLINRGASFEEKTSDGETVLDKAEEGKAWQLWLYIRSKKNMETYGLLDPDINTAIDSLINKTVPDTTRGSAQKSGR